MSDRERFLATMAFRPVDRGVIGDFSFWPETLDRWKEQGLPRRCTRNNADRYFGMDRWMEPAGLNVSLQPAFRQQVIEDRGSDEVVQQANGVRVLRGKYMGSIPMHLGHLLQDRASWEKHYKPRLDPSDPKRFPRNMEKVLPQWRETEGREAPLAVAAGSLFGWLRDWMGIEELSYLLYDEPELFEEMVETVTECILGTLERAFRLGARFDGAYYWEDMCYNAGPLLSPAHFKRYLVPRYQRINHLLKANGVQVIWLDSDGDISSLVPLWLEAGIDCLFPLEIGTWGTDPVAYRREYGKDLRMMGGFDKHLLAGRQDAIVAEVHRLAPLVEEGGFIPFCDHRVPPDVPLENYLVYLREARAVWGRGIHLKPMNRTLARMTPGGIA
jgi:uroporphyrinogen decarboxylase